MVNLRRTLASFDGILSKQLKRAWITHWYLKSVCVSCVRKWMYCRCSVFFQTVLAMSPCAPKPWVVFPMALVQHTGFAAAVRLLPSLQKLHDTKKWPGWWKSPDWVRFDGMLRVNSGKNCAEVSSACWIRYCEQIVHIRAEDPRRTFLSAIDRIS